MASIKPELNFGLDNFAKQKYLTEAQSVAQMLINLFLMKPGQLPSLPHIGIDIRKYMYEFEDQINSDVIRREITEQCPDILSYIDIGNLQLIVVPYNQDSILYLFIPLLVTVAENSALSIAFKKNNKTNEITFNYKIDTNLEM